MTKLCSSLSIRIINYKIFCKTLSYVVFLYYIYSIIKNNNTMENTMTTETLVNDIVNYLKSIDDFCIDTVYDVTADMAFDSGLFDETDNQWYSQVYEKVRDILIDQDLYEF